MMLASAAASMPVSGMSSLLRETTASEIALFIVGVIFTIGLLVAFIWITFRASREKQDV